MKLVRSGENAVRISLTAEDLRAFSVCLEDFDYDSTTGRRIIRELFDRAREETGFEAAKEKVYIQLYPKKDGGCELFVIKLEEEGETRECFAFHSFEDLFYARSLIPFPYEGCTFYRMPKQDEYLALIPSVAVTPGIIEHGEKLKKAPSHLYLTSRCKQIFTE